MYTRKYKKSKYNRYNKNKTKRGGEASEKAVTEASDNPVTNASEKAVTEFIKFGTNSVARMAGYIPIKESIQKEEPNKFAQGLSQGAATMVNSVNKIAASPEVENNISEALKNSANIVNGYVEKGIKQINNHELAKNLNKVSTLLEVAKPEIDHVIDKIADIVEHAGEKMLDSVVKVGLSASGPFGVVLTGADAVVNAAKVASVAAVTLVEGYSDVKKTFEKSQKKAQEILERTKLSASTFGNTDIKKAAQSAVLSKVAQAAQAAQATQATQAAQAAGRSKKHVRWHRKSKRR